LQTEKAARERGPFALKGHGFGRAEPASKQLRRLQPAARILLANFGREHIGVARFAGLRLVGVNPQLTLWATNVTRASRAE